MNEIPIVATEREQGIYHITVPAIPPAHVDADTTVWHTKSHGRSREQVETQLRASLQGFGTLCHHEYSIPLMLLESIVRDIISDSPLRSFRVAITKSESSHAVRTTRLKSPKKHQGEQILEVRPVPNHTNPILIARKVRDALERGESPVQAIRYVPLSQSKKVRVVGATIGWRGWIGPSNDIVATMERLEELHEEPVRLAYCTNDSFDFSPDVLSFVNKVREQLEANEDGLFVIPGVEQCVRNIPSGSLQSNDFIDFMKMFCAQRAADGGKRVSDYLTTKTEQKDRRA